MRKISTHRRCNDEVNTFPYPTVFFPDRVSKLEHLVQNSLHCTLFGEDNRKLGTQFRLRLEYSNVELQSAYRIE